MAAQRFLNNFDWQFIGPVTAGTHVGYETTIGRGVLQISDAAGALLGTLTGGDWYVLTAYKRSGSVESAIEIIKVLGVNEVGYAAPGECRIRVERGHEGTTPQTYVATDLISMRLTAGGLNDLASDAELATKEPAIAAGTTAQFWRGDKTWQDLFTQVRTATLNGLSTATSTVVAAADTVLVALGKLQAQVSLKLNAANPAFTGDITASSTGARIKADFSNATIANRMAFQTSTPNSNTTVLALPSGTATTSGFLASNTADPTNCSEASLLATPTDIRVSSATRGSGTFLPLTFYTNGLERMRVAVDGTTTFVAAPFGYGAGAGGTATQVTSKGQAVVMATAKPSGRITMHGASLAAGSSIEFGFTNSMLAATDGIVVRPDGFTGYAVEVAYFNSATEVILRVTNKGATRSDALVIVFQLVKGSIT